MHDRSWSGAPLPGSGHGYHNHARQRADFPARCIGAGPLFLERMEPLGADARREAVEKATRQASELAVAAGVTLGPIRSIVEGSAGAPPGPRPMLRAMVAAEAVPLEPGTQRLSVTVEIEWEITG